MFKKLIATLSMIVLATSICLAGFGPGVIKTPDSDKLDGYDSTYFLASSSATATYLPRDTNITLNGYDLSIVSADNKGVHFQSSIGTDMKYAFRYNASLQTLVLDAMSTGNPDVPLLDFNGGWINIKGQVASILSTDGLIVATTDYSDQYIQISAKKDEGAYFILGGGASDGESNRNLIITDYNNYGKFHGHDQVGSNPTIFVHSIQDPTIDQDDWFSMSYSSDSNRAEFITQGNFYFNSALFETDGPAKITGALQVTGATTLDSTLQVKDIATFDKGCSVVGSSSSTYTVEQSTDAPTNAVTPSAWVLIKIGSVYHKMPVYQ